MQTAINSPFAGFRILYEYTRAQALADGLLIDATPLAREAGFKWPVYLTADAWAETVAWSAADYQRTFVAQDERGRLWDVLTMLSLAARNATSCLLHFELFRVPRDGSARTLQRTRLKAVIAPGEAGLPCITIMLPNED